MHTWKYALLRWRINNKHFSESLEQLASYNEADMYKYNMLYTFKINQDVLAPESHCITKNVPWHILAPAAVACDICIVRRSAHPRGAFLCNRNEVSYYTKNTCRLCDRQASKNYFQISSATLFTSSSFAHCCSSVSLFPISQDAKPH